MNENEPNVNQDSLLEKKTQIENENNENNENNDNNENNENNENNDNNVSMRDIPLSMENEKENIEENISEEELKENIEINNPIDSRNIEINNKNEKTDNSNNENKEEEYEKETKEYSTLDETISETLLRDFKVILHKIKYVLLPQFVKDKTKEIRNWDLWGPLLICFSLCLILTFGNSKVNEDSSFVLIFSIVWIGGFIINLNAKILGVNIGFFQVFCLLGYCLFPILVSAIIIIILLRNDNYNLFFEVLKILILILCVCWSCFASVGFVGSLTNKDKKFIVCYPIFIFYISISMFVLNC